MNNLEYRTLIQGLGVVVASYGKSSGYQWEPVSLDPSYLKIMGPEFNFLDLAKSFGVNHGSRVADPALVREAVDAGVAHVLREKTSYVIEIFSDPALAPDGPEPTPSPARSLISHSRGETSPPLEQPPVDTFYQAQGTGV